MHVPIGFCDRIGMQHAVWPALLEQLRRAGEQAVAFDSAIHHDVPDMDVLWPIFSGNALRQISHRRFGRRERREVRGTASKATSYFAWGCFLILISTVRLT